MYGFYVLPVLLYGFEVWSVTKDAFDTWSLPKILRIPYTKHVTNFTVRQTTGCPPVSHCIRERDDSASLGMWVARADPEQDQHRVIEASLRPPSHWRRPCGRLRTSWLRAIDTDVQSVNIGIHSAWRKASDCTLWRRIVDTTTLHHGTRSH